jgi:hypothetical protein
MNKLKILICSGFTETELISFRENQYPRIISSYGHDVVVSTSNRSYIWKYNRSKSKQTEPAKNDVKFMSEYGYEIKRKNPFIRIGDFVIMSIPLIDIIKADVVHVIEFRQGYSVMVAMVAKILGKRVVYDHEQRGDRHYSILHTVDSAFRRILIGIGSLFVDYVRHTVYVNGEHYLKNAWKKPKCIKLSPLAADERVFFFDPEIRKLGRLKYRLIDGEKVYILSGKLGESKKTNQVLQLLCSSGSRVIVAGTVDDETSKFIKKNSDLILYVGSVDASELNILFNVADVAIFTTFSVSYWEALSAGLNIIVPRSRFSEAILVGENCILFGSEDMFSVVEEQYISNYDLTGDVKAALNTANKIIGNRKTDGKYTWSEVGKSLVDCYVSLASKK